MEAWLPHARCYKFRFRHRPPARHRRRQGTGTGRPHFVRLPQPLTADPLGPLKKAEEETTPVSLRDGIEVQGVCNTSGLRVFQSHYCL